MIREADAKAMSALVKDMEAIKAKYPDTVITGDDAEKFNGYVAELSEFKAQAESFGLADDLKALLDQPIAPVVHNTEAPREARSLTEQILGKREDFRGLETGVAYEATLKTLVGPTTSGGGYGVEHDRAEGVLYPMVPLTARQLFTVGTTSSHAVEYFRQSARTNNASGVSEEITDSASTNVKPENAVTFELVTDTVKTIATTIPVTKNIMNDFGQLSTILDNDLMYSLEIEEELQLLHGAGGNDLQGVIAATGTQSHTRVSGDSIADTIRRMSTKSFLGSYVRPEWVVVSPQTLEGIEIAKASTAGTYLYMVVNGRIWGLAVYESPSMDTGTAHKLLVGNSRDAVIWDREAANVEVGFVDKQFAQNYRTLLAEKRLAFGIKRPASYVYASITEDGSGYIS